MSDTHDADPSRAVAARRLARLASTQHGIFTRAQAVACGFHPRMIDRRISAGIWDRLYAGVYGLAGVPASWRQSLLAACLAWGGGAVASHRAAAALRLLPGFPAGPIELIVPRDRNRMLSHRVHRPSRPLDAEDVATIDAIPVTSAARTLIDLAGCSPRHLIEEALDDALRRRLVSFEALARRVADHRGPGRRGTRVLATLLDARAGSSAVPQSVFETRLLRTLRAAGLPEPVVQHRIDTHAGPAVVDFAFVEHRVAIEADGFQWHSSRRRWDLDRARRNALTMLGWRIIHVTWPQLRDRPEEVIEAVKVTITGSRPI